MAPGLHARRAARLLPPPPGGQFLPPPRTHAFQLCQGVMMDPSDSNENTSLPRNLMEC